MAVAASTLQDPAARLVAMLLGLRANGRRFLARLDSRQRTLLAIVALGCLGGLGKLVASILRRDASGKKRERELFRQNSSVLLKDGWSREIMVPNPKGGVSRVVIRPTKKMTFEAHRRLFLEPAVSEQTATKRKQGRFFREFSAIWSIIVPDIRSKTTALLAIHALFLAGRTYLSLLVAKLDGQIVRDLIAANGKEFLKGLGYWLLLAVPASYTNAMIRFLQAKLSIAFRTKLIRYIHDLYLSKELGYYKVNNVDGSIEGADQFITADVTRFCDAAAALYSNLGKPSVDFLIFSYQLQRNLGPQALVGIMANYLLTAWLLKKMAPPFGRLAAAEARLEGDYRNAHTKLITNAEEIAFYDGTGLERSILTKTYRRLVAHIAKILRIRVSYIMFEDFVLKYSWSAAGYLFASIPVFLPAWSGVEGRAELVGAPASISVAAKDFRERDRMKQFITNKRLMLSLADAGGRMMYSIKDLAELAGYTSRVYQLLSTLHRVHADAYGDQLAPGEEAPEYSLADVKGTVQQGFDGVRFEGTPIVVPGTGRNLAPGELLIEDLDVHITPGQHVLISGANGVGKTSIARVLAGLWPVFRGLVSKPLPEDIAFLPQRPYLSNGTLREQIIYPHSHADMIEAGRTDSELMEILKLVKLEYIPSREGGWETRKQWKDVFSGGEKQRVMFARILYQAPRFAVIDEGTSAVSQDVEGLLYEVCKRRGITLITISHRISLLKYHTAQLKVGLGSDGTQWQFEYLGSKEAKLSVAKEIEEIRAKLAQVPQWEARREEITRLLSGKA